MIGPFPDRLARQVARRPSPRSREAGGEVMGAFPARSGGAGWDEHPSARGAVFEPGDSYTKQAPSWPVGSVEVQALLARFLYDRFSMGWWQDRRFRLGLELSLLLHLLLLLLPDRLRTVHAVAAKPVLQAQEEEKPLRFELVELPEQREEKPSRADAPGSDLSRRAHGGQGDKAERPGMAGNTPELRLAAPSPAQGAATPPSQPSPPEPRAPGHQTPQAQGEPARAETTGLEGAGIVAAPQRQRPPQSSPVPQPPLRGLTPFSAPGLGVVPDRQGGQVDLGPLSFDTQWYDWGPYAAEMLRRIRYHWKIPELAQLGVPGVVRIRFFIEKDGRVTGLTILKDSSHPPMDFAARDAILNASPLPPLPEEVGVEREGVIITFYYNVRPPEDS